MSYRLPEGTVHIKTGKDDKGNPLLFLISGRFAVTEAVPKIELDNAVDAQNVVDSALTRALHKLAPYIS